MRGLIGPKRWVYLLTIVLIAIILINGYFSLQRSRRNRRYQASFDALSKDLKKGMTRQQAEDLLRQKSVGFKQRSGIGTYTVDDVITLDRESGLPVCNYVDTVIRVVFVKSQQDSNYEAHPDDLVEAVVLRSEPQACL
jgi:hypothetical protein